MQLPMQDLCTRLAPYMHDCDSRPACKQDATRLLQASTLEEKVECARTNVLAHAAADPVLAHAQHGRLAPVGEVGARLWH